LRIDLRRLRGEERECERGEEEKREGERERRREEEKRGHVRKFFIQKKERY
jgi:hypothetical protein